MKKALILACIALVAVPSASVAKTPNHHSSASRISHGSDYYTNVNGHSVHRPMRSQSQPRGATARCRDGTWSFSENHRGTCSRHGGVASWL
ncbi:MULTISPECIES: DUF3761 domain-containing protein [unclassified Novosphingobium]|uniref:DUF3761 domain-containing protein n=1 Tax=unclassified Novosphingobium TaxID=2644732 RepID=UPI0010BD77EF|nr:DUF3761 domain-containing protein [Novosphingobium sp. EMRT-2]QCI96355.1 DUF3761 domain-containing protein [Novosphingobium sp. EMRT-2]